MKIIKEKNTRYKKKIMLIKTQKFLDDLVNFLTYKKRKNFF